MDEYLRGPAVAVFVAEQEGGGLAGFVEAALRSEAIGCGAGPIGYIEGWYVDVDQRRQGLGRQLVQAGEEWARGRGCRQMASDAEVENAVSRRAHAALGYQEVIRLAHFRKPLTEEAVAGRSGSGAGAGEEMPPAGSPGYQAPSAAKAVLLETERLFVRPWVPDDWVRFRPLGTDPRVLEFLATEPWTDERIRRFINKGIEVAATRGWILWPVIHRQDGVLIGFCGFSDEFPPEVEIGWRLLPEYWGRGLATEAARAVLKYGFQTIGFGRVISVIHHANQRSIRVAQKLGMTLERRFVHRGVEVVCYARANPLTRP
jgi:aminoglycoside 6'-N-acetyltransferase I